tara:strand:- start:2054 stop:2485 length:432 start_codon:yes stop_codon:yes gene_type:complete
MNLERITYKIIKDSMDDEFILKMMISYLSDEQKGTVMDEIVNEREHILLKKNDIVWFDPKDNKYDLKECYEDDMMKDTLKMDENSYIKGRIIDDCDYQSGCNPYATEYKIIVNFHTSRDGRTTPSKEIRVKRSNIMGLWKALE